MRDRTRFSFTWACSRRWRAIPEKKRSGGGLPIRADESRLVSRFFFFVSFFSGLFRLVLFLRVHGFCIASRSSSGLFASSGLSSVVVAMIFSLSSEGNYESSNDSQLCEKFHDILLQMIGLVRSQERSPILRGSCRNANIFFTRLPQLRTHRQIRLRKKSESMVSLYTWRQSIGYSSKGCSPFSRSL